MYQFFTTFLGPLLHIGMDNYNYSELKNQTEPKLNRIEPDSHKHPIHSEYLFFSETFYFLNLSFYYVKKKKKKKPSYRNIRKKTKFKNSFKFHQLNDANIELNTSIAH